MVTVMDTYSETEAEIAARAERERLRQEYLEKASYYRNKASNLQSTVNLLNSKIDNVESAYGFNNSSRHGTVTYDEYTKYKYYSSESNLLLTTKNLLQEIREAINLLNSQYNRATELANEFSQMAASI
ncbi:MAG: hypothetical protein ACK5L6_05710 [Anaerorhabdus sp.]|uniref:hypothetical protein n=1 Tax=Anaerorhabdus sp. TaxID=1872524 RepID=UPI003A881DE6